MTLLGHRAQNHPQQVTRRGAVGDVDDRAITDEDFAPLHARFDFTIDAAAAPHNAKLPRYWTAEDDALTQSWTGERVWCNPPYSDIRPWVEKAHREWDWRYRIHNAVTCTGCRYCEPTMQRSHLMRIVMLLPANRTEQRWWQDLVEPRLRAHDPDFRVEFLPGRMRFDRPGWTPGPKGNRPPFGCCLLIWGDR